MRVLISVLCILSVAVAWSVEISPGLYKIRSRLIMPNLAENLRYAQQAETHCLMGVTDDAFNYSLLLPILKHVSLANCRLNKTQQQQNLVDLRLVCPGEKNATGVARINIEKDRISAQLDIQMGGKNMTFSQYSIAIRQRGCDL